MQTIANCSNFWPTVTPSLEILAQQNGIKLNQCMKNSIRRGKVSTAQSSRQAFSVCTGWELTANRIH